MGDGFYSLQALLQAPAADGNLDRLRYLIGRLPLLVSRIEASIHADDRSRLRALTHDGKGLYTELGRADEYFSQMYSIALSANPSELEGIVGALRSESARLAEALEHSDESQKR